MNASCFIIFWMNVCKMVGRIFSPVNWLSCQLAREWILPNQCEWMILVGCSLNWVDGLVSTYLFIVVISIARAADPVGSGSTYIAGSGSGPKLLEPDSAGSEPIMLDPDPILLGPILLDSETTGSGSNCIRTYIAGSGSNWIRSYIARFWYYWIRTYIFAGSGIFWRLDRFLYLKNTYLTIINTFNAFI